MSARARPRRRRRRRRRREPRKSSPNATNGPAWTAAPPVEVRLAVHLSFLHVVTPELRPLRGGGWPILSLLPPRPPAAYRLHSLCLSAHAQKPSETVEEEAGVTPAHSHDEEVEEKPKGEEGEEEEGKISHQKDRTAEEEVKKNEANEKKDGEKTRASGKGERDTQEEVLKSQQSREQKDKEPSPKAAISCFFGEEVSAWLQEALLCLHICCFLFFFSKAPRKAAVKMEKPDKHEEEKKMSAERKSSTEEDKEAKW